MEHTYDAIVIGARCAGSTTAMLLARQGRRVLVVDRAPFPSDPETPSANLTPDALWHLRQWNLEDRLARTGAPPIRRMVTHVGGTDVTADCPSVEGVDHCLCVRRSVLDMLLAQSAIEAGADVMFGTRVTSMPRDGERVVGIVATDRDGRTVDARAPIVIGADGRSSFVARTVGAAVLEERPARGRVAFTYYVGLDVEDIERWQGEAGQLFLLPSHYGETWVVLVQHGASSGDTEAHLASFPDAAARLARGRRIAPVRVAGDGAIVRRTPSGPGWALVGDAAVTRDPMTGWGVTDAFAQAGRLTDAIELGEPLDDHVRDRQLATCRGA